MLDGDELGDSTVLERQTLLVRGFANCVLCTMLDYAVSSKHSATLLEAGESMPKSIKRVSRASSRGSEQQFP